MFLKKSARASMVVRDNFEVLLREIFSQNERTTMVMSEKITCNKSDVVPQVRLYGMQSINMRKSSRSQA